MLAGRLASGDTPVFTASFGVAPSWCDDQLEGVVKAADTALYRAKSQGRDRVVADDGIATVPHWEPDTAIDAPLATRALAGFAALAENDDPLDSLIRFETTFDIVEIGAVTSRGFLRAAPVQPQRYARRVLFRRARRVNQC